MGIKNHENDEYGAMVYILGHKCYRCDHCWRPIDIEKIPKVCPKCKSPYWDRPKVKGEK